MPFVQATVSVVGSLPPNSIAIDSPPVAADFIGSKSAVFCATVNLPLGVVVAMATGTAVDETLIGLFFFSWLIVTADGMVLIGEVLFGEVDSFCFDSCLNRLVCLIGLALRARVDS